MNARVDPAANRWLVRLDLASRLPMIGTNHERRASAWSRSTTLVSAISGRMIWLR
jgi:hypothetical protein